MKKSHYTTPRTMADAQFASWADPIERPHRQAMRLSPWAVVSVVILVCAAALWRM
jgi:hypothetical protein